MLAQLASSHFERTGSCCSGRTCRNSSSAQAARPARACSPGPCGRRTGSDPERRNLCAHRRTTSARCRSPHPAIVMMLSRVSETEARQIEKVSLFYVVRRHDEQGRIPHSLPDQLIRPVSSPVQVSETVPAQLDGTQGITRTRCPSLCPSRSAWSRRHGPPCSSSPPEFAPTPAAPRTARAQTGTLGGGRRGGRGCGLGSDRSRSPSLTETKQTSKLPPQSSGEMAAVSGGRRDGRLPRTEVGGVINVIDHLRRRVLVHPHILRAVRAGRIALEDGGCAVRHHVEARVAPVIVLGPAEVLPSQSRRITAQAATETGRRQSCMSCAERLLVQNQRRGRLLTPKCVSKPLLAGRWSVVM